MTNLLAYPSKIKTRQIKGRLHRNRVYAIPCPTCGDNRWLKSYDAKNALTEKRNCLSCSNKIKSKLSQTAINRKKAFLGMQRHLKAKTPSLLEKMALLALKSLKLVYEYQALLAVGDDFFIVDFLVRGKVAVEINGDYWHRNTGPRDSYKYSQLESGGYTCVWISEDEMKSGAFFRILQSIRSR